ncbi:MAG: M48 family metallopeptidase [Pseudomonadota bacterium]
MSIWEKAGGGAPAERSAPAPLFADYFDGERALRQRVSLIHEDGVRGRVLRLNLPDGGVVRWPARRVRRLADQVGAGTTTFGLSTGGEARLVTTDKAAKDLVLALDPKAAGRLPGPALGRRALVVSGAGVACIAALIFVLLPALAGVLAGHMDPEAEQAMGDIHYDQTRTMFASFGGPLQECRNPAGQAALDDMTERVAEGVDLPYDLVVRVLDDSRNPALNAYAVAGGRITFFHSMILAAESPDEIAAVLAHELGHVVYDDPVRHMLQSAAAMAVLSVLIGDVTGGGLIGGTAGAALQSSYSRTAEVRADAFARDQLTAVGLPPSALGRMFERFRDRYGDTEGLVAHFSTHPQLADRIAAAGARGDPVSGAPALSDRAWQDLRAICD